MDIEFRHLFYFVAVAQERSFNRGAQRIGISQPTLTRQLNELEARLGVQLFLKHRQGVMLSEAGGCFLVHAEAILREHDQMLSELRRLDRKRLKLGYIAPLLFGPAGEAIAQLRRTHPHVILEIVEAAPAQQLQMLAQGTLDLALIGHAVLPPGSELRLLPLYPIPLAAVVASHHRLAGRSSICLSELSGEAFLGLQESRFPGRQAVVAGACQAAGFRIQFVQLADSLLSLLTLIGHGQGVSLVPIDVSKLAHPSVVFVPLEGAPRVHFHAAVREGTRCEVVDGLLEACVRIGEVYLQS